MGDLRLIASGLARAALTLGAIHCSNYTGGQGATPHDGGSVDGAPVDAPVDAGAANADGGPVKPRTCALPNLLKNGDFEQNGIFWDSFGNATPTLNAHGGTKALELVRAEGGSLSQNVAIPANAVHVRFWFQVPGNGVDRIFAGIDGNAIPGTDHMPRVEQQGRWQCLEGVTMGPSTYLRLSTRGVGDVRVLFDDVDLVDVPATGLPPECLCPVM
jgi:hypothetical protein